MTRVDQASIGRGHSTAAQVHFTFILPGFTDQDQCWLHLSLWVTSCQYW